MKLAVVIVCLTAIAVGVVHFRRERTHLGNEIERLQKRQETLREDLWRQQARMAPLMEPAAIRSRAQDLEIPLTDGAPRTPGPTPAAPGRRRPAATPATPAPRGMD